uniref:CHCH domain-containing protein n=1 Tax=viral metagenome TaxID=1070528 RepID=A0A6C0BBF5_9ZZZZ
MPRSKSPSVHHSVPPKPVGLAVVPPKPVVVPSLAQTLKEGFAFGIGSSVARTAVDRMFSTKEETVDCSDQKRLFDLCLLIEGNESFCGNDKNRYKKCLEHSTSKSIPLEKE